jgi:hypothetical protein
MAEQPGQPGQPANNLPNLSGLTLEYKPRDQLTRQASDGLYCLDTLDASQRGFKISDLSQCQSSVILVRNALNVTDQEAAELDAFMVRVPRTINPNNSKMFIKRKQATFGAKYKFAGQNVPYYSDYEEWPTAVKKALAFSKQVVKQLRMRDGRPVDDELFNAVHTNLYEKGDIALAEHQDEEREMVKGLPILSYTLLTGDPKPRDFVISMKETPEEYLERQRQRDEEYRLKGEALPKNTLKPAFHAVATVTLRSNDMLIMQGNMQSKETGYWHGVPEAKPPKEYKQARRLNMTVRAFKEEAVAEAAAAAAKRAREE